ncbi:MAG TPA: TetR/AcrR family transcriptional regulator [Steroidobacteraceae bacterium]|jgi:AcrR family transcriptional regulator
MRGTPEIQKPREAILEAAVALFGKRGYAGTTMRDIAGEVGVLPGSLYAHISSKETLLDEIVELGIESFLAIEANLPDEGSGADKMRAAIKAHVAVAAVHPGRSLVVFHQWRFLTEPNLTRALNKRRRYQQLFVRLIDEGIADGSFAPSLDTKIAVFTILGALNWIPEWYSPRGHYGPAEIGERIADQLLRGLQPAKANASKRAAG